MERGRAIVVYALMLLALTAPVGVDAAEDLCRSTAGGHCVNLAASAIPGLEFLQDVATPSGLLSKLYTYGVSLVGLSAFLVFTYGAIGYMVSIEGGAAKAKERMKNAIFGLALALVSYLLLLIINPDIVKKRLDVSLPKLEEKRESSETTGTTGTWICPVSSGAVPYPSKSVCETTCSAPCVPK